MHSTPMASLTKKKRDSVLGVYIWSLASRTHHLVGCFKKSQLCRCGCKTWCSLHEISSWLHWASAALSTGTWPSDRHDSRAWGDSDAGRQICAGQRLGFKAAVVFIKADWAECVSTFGFPAWNSVEMDPCHICPAPLPEFYSLDWLTPLGMRHPSKTLQSYLDACDRCEIRVALHRDQHVAIRGALWWDKRKDTGASHGRGLRHDLPSLGLLKMIGLSRGKAC